MSSTLRSPKEMVTASKLASAYGSLQRVGGDEAQVGLARACRPAACPSDRSVGTTVAPAWANGSLDVPVPAARSKISCPGRGCDGLHDELAPGPVLAEGQHVVGQVVPGGDPVEHGGDLATSLVERRAARMVLQNRSRS